MLNYTNLEDIKELLQKILEELEFMNLPPKTKQEEWDSIDANEKDELEKIREKYQDKLHPKKEVED